MEWWDLTLSILPPSEGYISQNTPQWLYGLIVNKTSQEIKWYTVRIRTQLGIYGQIYPFAFRSSLGLCPWELLQAKGYIWPYIPPLVLIQIQYTLNNTTFYSSLGASIIWLNCTSFTLMHKTTKFDITPSTLH